MQHYIPLEEASNLWLKFVYESGYRLEIEGHSWEDYKVWLNEKLKPWHATIVGSIHGIEFDSPEDAVAFVLRFS